MISKKYLSFGVALVLCWGIMFCGESLNYTLVIRSNVSYEIDDACLEFDGQKGVWGVLSPFSRAGRANNSFPIPEIVEVTWKNTVTEEDHRYKLEVRSKVPQEFKPYRDAIVFSIQPDNSVKLSFKVETGQFTWEEIEPD